MCRRNYLNVEKIDQTKFSYKIFFFFLKTCNFFNFWYFWLKICASKIFLTKIDVRMWVTHNVPRGLNEQAF